MFHIYDTFEITGTMLNRYKELMTGLEEGLMVVFDYHESFDPANFVGRMVEIRKPNGEIIRHRIAQAQIRGSALGLLLSGLKRGDVPAGSELLLV
jgi:hypothetical protein